MIKGVLFDLDGTLIDTNELTYKSFLFMFKEIFDKELPKSEITKFYGKPLEESLSKFAEDDIMLNKMISTYRKYNKANHDSLCKVFDGVVEMLEKLKERNIKIAIVTSKKRDMAKRGLKVTNIFKYIDVIITPEDTTKHKPEGETAMKACEILKLDPKEVLMVGDSPYDLMCGKNAGTLCCGVEYTEIDLSELMRVKPDYMIKKPIDLLEVI